MIALLLLVRMEGGVQMQWLIISARAPTTGEGRHVPQVSGVQS